MRLLRLRTIWRTYKYLVLRYFLAQNWCWECGRCPSLGALATRCSDCQLSSASSRWRYIPTSQGARCTRLFCRRRIMIKHADADFVSIYLLSCPHPTARVGRNLAVVVATTRCVPLFPIYIGTFFIPPRVYPSCPHPLQITNNTLIIVSSTEKKENDLM
ncbi:hypothetical protein PAXRUDRAFT_562891 [Paxillus rubicundulus Ve08.2h10]|uniref:Unplaced genomic scaffold scaffold_438, whole genome shotgun sequence n=1 Tax=Paxillus rubicundulus Ve08.2h10 TaxID=930991 RepID=A0A0D0E595_9AGAM|nr:hypothetical protein PAXRUDRAFT_562891 [Paxillus rubicundulus Ve08.2h10]